MKKSAIINEFILLKCIIMPFTAPSKAPEQIPIKIAAAAGKPDFKPSAINMPERDTIDPAERSMAPDTMTRFMPMANIILKAIASNIF